MSTPTKHLEIETHVHNGVGVRVRIDYDAGKISLLNNDGKAKQWVFSDRQIQYMAGWQNILDAMKSAVACAENKLKKHQDEIVRAVMKRERDMEKLTNRAVKESAKQYGK